MGLLFENQRTGERMGVSKVTLRSGQIERGVSLPVLQAAEPALP